MKCDEILELLPLYLEDMLDNDEKTQVEEHLEKCPSCREELKFLAGIINEAGRLPEIEPSAEFEAKLHEKLLIEKNTEKTKILFNKNWKNYFTLAASAAVIAISVVALNTEFYKVDESILGENSRQYSQAHKTDTYQEEKEDLSKQEAQELAETQQKINAKNETGKAIVKNNNTAAADIDAISEDATKEIAEQETESQVPQVASELKAEEQTAAFSQENVCEENDKEDVADTKTASSGGGGAARSFNIMPTYDKIIFTISDFSQNEELYEKLLKYECYGKEYRLPLDEFYELTGELVAFPDSDGFYTAENMTEEYNELNQKLVNEATDDLDAVKKRIAQIEEICSFGYIVIK